MTFHEAVRRAARPVAEPVTTEGVTTAAIEPGHIDSFLRDHDLPAADDEATRERARARVPQRGRERPLLLVLPGEAIGETVVMPPPRTL